METKDTRTLLYAPFKEEDLISEEIPDKYKSNVEFKIARCARRLELGLDKKGSGLSFRTKEQVYKYFNLL